MSLILCLNLFNLISDRPSVAPIIPIRDAATNVIQSSFNKMSYSWTSEGLGVSWRSSPEELARQETEIEIINLICAQNPHIVREKDGYNQYTGCLRVADPVLGGIKVWVSSVTRNKFSDVVSQEEILCRIQECLESFRKGREDAKKLQDWAEQQLKRIKKPYWKNRLSTQISEDNAVRICVDGRETLTCLEKMDLADLEWAVHQVTKASFKWMIK